MSYEKWPDALKWIMPISKNEGWIPDDNIIPHIPELMALADETTLQIYKDISAYMDVHHPDAPSRKIFTSFGFCVYAGIGAVYFWNKDWDQMQRKGLYESLTEERGIFAMDEYVSDCIGYYFNTKDGEELANHINEISFKMLEKLVAIKEDESIGYQIREYLKASFVYGMIFEMHQLGMH